MIRLLLGMTLATLLLAPHAGAGECAGGAEEYVAALERGPGAELFDYAISCLSSYSQLDTRRWAGRNAQAYFASLRADSLNPRLARTLATLRMTAWADTAQHRFELFGIAARHGIAHIDTADVFRALLESSEGTDAWDRKTLYEDLAILQDCRAVEYLRRRYLELRADPGHGHPDEILDVANCLYHMPCAEAVSTAHALAAKEKDPDLRERLQRVVNRK